MSNPNPSPSTRFVPGQSGNPGGRPKGTLKEYVREKFKAMTPEEKEKFIKDLPKELLWKMSEGNPAQESDITSGGEKITSLDTPYLQDLATKIQQLDEADFGTDKPSDGTDTKPLGEEVSD